MAAEVENPVVDKYEFLNKDGVLELAKSILSTVNERISERIVDTLDVNSDGQHIPSALAVYRAVTDRTHLSMMTITGDINTQVPLESRSSEVIYMQKDDETDPTWAMYMWNPDGGDDATGEWISLGNTEVDLSNYWSKSADDIVGLKAALGIDSLEAIQDAEQLMADVNGIKTDVGTMQTSITEINNTMETKVSNDALVAIPSGEITNIIEQAVAATDTFNSPSPV